MDAWSLARAMWGRRTLILVTTAVVVGAAFLVISMITPRYSSTAEILIENRQAGFAGSEQDQSFLDDAAVLSQVQILSSRGLGATVVDDLDLAANPEFNRDPRNSSWIRRALVSVGLVKPVTDQGAVERATDTYLDRLSVYRKNASRVIAIEFSSENADLAAEVANTLADEYLALQRTAKSNTNQETVSWLERDIERLRGEVAAAEAAVAQYRSESGIFESARDGSLSEQQLSELNAELIRASAAKSEAQAKANLIEKLLKEPSGIEDAAEVLSSPLIQRLREQQAAVSREQAELSATLLSGHPRMRQLSAELADLESRIAAEARKIARGLEHEAQVAGAREAAIRRSLADLKVDAGEVTKSEVKLRALEREAAAQRETFETLLRRYREASARQDVAAQPANARIISRATPALKPSYPPRGPILALSSIVGVLLGLLFAFFAEVFGRGSRSEASEAVTPRRLARQDAADTSSTEVPQSMSEDEGEGSSVTERREPALPDDVEPDTTQIGERLIRLIDGRGARRLAIVSLGDAENALAVAGRVGHSMALGGLEPIVVDATPSTDQSGGKGLFDLLAGEASLGEVMVPANAETPAMIPAGAPRGDSDILIASGRLALVLDALTARFRPAIVVAGGLDRGATALAIANAAELALVLVASDQITGAKLKEAIGRLQESGASQAAILSDGPQGLTLYDPVSVRGAIPDAA